MSQRTTGTVLDKDKRKLKIMRESKLEWPQLYMDVHFIGDSSEATNFAIMFSKAVCRKADSLEKADLVVFGGGIDVNPSLYGKSRHASVSSISYHRDTADMEAYYKCLELGIPMLGICRGAQFLWVMNGGELFQDVDGHYGDHNLWDVHEMKMIHGVSSVHHQMCKKTEGMSKPDLLAVASSISKKRWNDANSYQEGKDINEIEAFFIPETICLGIQGHPEYHGYQNFALWALKQVQKCILTNENVSWEGSILRHHNKGIEPRVKMLPKMEVVG